LSFVCLVRIQLHFPETHSLKGKRKELQGVKSALQRRFGAAVAETDHHDLWQRAELSAAVVSRTAAGAEASAAKVERYVRSCFPDGVATERALVSSTDLLEN
jgi:uncharacterized protein